MTYPYHMRLWDNLQRMKLNRRKAAAIKRAVEQARAERLRNAVQLRLL